MGFYSPKQIQFLGPHKSFIYWSNYIIEGGNYELKIWILTSNGHESLDEFHQLTWHILLK